MSPEESAKDNTKTPLDLTEQITIRLSPMIMDGIDWYADILSTQEHRRVGRNDAARKLIVYAVNALQKERHQGGANSSQT